MDNHDIKNKVLEVIRSLQNKSEDWVPLTNLSAPLKSKGVDYTDDGKQKLL